MFPVPQLPEEEPQISLTVPPPVQEETITLRAPVDPVEQAELVEQVCTPRNQSKGNASSMGNKDSSQPNSVYKQMVTL